MSNLDQAFIRAYQAGPTTSARPQAAAAPTTAAVAMAAPITSTGAMYAAAEPTIERAPLHSADATLRHYVDAAHAVPSNHLQTAIPVYAEPAVSVAASAPPAPLETGMNAPFQAAFETRRFAWPRAAEVLIAAAGTEFSAFVTELEERIRSGRQTLVFTGAERGEGRTTVMLALARLLANRGLRTALVDCDLKAPALAEVLGVRPEVGWDDVYAERLSVTDAMIESLEDRVTVLPMRNGLANPRVMAGNRMFAGMIDTLRSHFDAVLIDVGPLSDDPSAIDLTSALTGTRLDDALVVRDRRRTSSKDMQAVCRRLSALGIHHWDIAENFTEIQGY
ncbi:MAG: hypothetical protein QM775_07185 [Pirellulales bacterium]